MKTTASFVLAVIFPLLAMTQVHNSQLLTLKTLDKRTVDLEEIFQDNTLTIVYFFNEGSRNLTDQFDYLENLAEEHGEGKIKVIAVCNASNSNYAQVQPMINGNDISLETLIDENGEMQRALGLPVNSNIILTRYTNRLTGHYTQAVSYSPEQADMELSQLLCSEDSYCDTYLSNNISAK